MNELILVLCPESGQFKLFAMFATGFPDSATLEDAIEGRNKHKGKYRRYCKATYNRYA